MKVAPGSDNQFIEIVSMIKQSRYNAIKNVNSELVNLYWNIGEYISKKLETAEWGDAVVDGLAEHIQEKHPEFKGFTRRGLFRMRQFYETYRQGQFVSAVLTQISWTNHLLILSKTKTKEEREFYLAISIKEKYVSRELERQIDSSLFERVILSKEKVSSLMTQIHPNATEVFKDVYVLDFLNLPEAHSESNLSKGIVSNLKNFELCM